MSTSYDQRAAELRDRYEAAAIRHPRARIRTLAGELGVSELELMAAQVGDIQATALRSPVQDIFRELGALGRVMALTRNEHCVHERHGRYEDIRAGNTMGIVLGPDIDLRMFFTNWRHAWAVESGGRKSLQFFDCAGMPVHKVFLTEESDESGWDSLVSKFAETDLAWPVIEPLQSATEALSPSAPPELRQDWLAMQDTHEFFGLLKRHKVERQVALRDVGADLAQQVAVETAERMLTDVARGDIPFMCFVGNHGMIQIHSGPVKRAAPYRALVQRTGTSFQSSSEH